MFLLDTNVVSELRKSGTGRADPNVVVWATSLSAGSLYISGITVLELELGVLPLERRDAAQGPVLRSWMTANVMPAFAGRVVPVDSAVALRCAQLDTANMHMPNRRPERDCLIAATALVHGMMVATRNVADFEGTGVAMLDPWQRSSTT